MDNLADVKHSFPLPEWELLWRLEDLKDRLNELEENGSCYQSGYWVLSEDVRYVLPEDPQSIWDVEHAIEFAVEDLEEQYGITVDSN